jgi:hypothetical protein
LPLRGLVDAAKPPKVKSLWYFLLAASAVALVVHVRNRDTQYFFGRSKADLATPAPAGEIVVAPHQGGELGGRWPGH